MRDGRRIVFATLAGLSAISIDGGEARVIRARSAVAEFPLAWSADGRTMAFSVADPTTSRDVWTMTEGGEPRAYLATPADERSAGFSPNGRWMTFSVLESGRPERVYVERFPDGGGRVLVSPSAVEPLWSPLGNEIFYRSLDGREMWSVPVDDESGQLGSPVQLFDGPYHLSPDGFWTEYDVASDGRRFLMIRSEDVVAADTLHVVVNGVPSTPR
jgi:Tol biopolymer transport system component